MIIIQKGLVITVKILVINAGSSSLKFQLIEMEQRIVLIKGLVERIGMDGSCLKQDVGGQKTEKYSDIPSHKAAIRLVLDSLLEIGCISSLQDIDAVGHRVSHGGERFKTAVLIDDDVVKFLYEIIDLAPLHTPANISGIEACRENLPNTPMSAVFDTTFHQTMPPFAYLYPIPMKYYEKYYIRRYGFHGTSHLYVARIASKMLGRDLSELKLITCHLGNGASAAAIDCGKSVDTSMGFTPLEGIVMGTRSGDVDPAVVDYLCKRLNIQVEKAIEILNKESGLLGLSGISSDIRDVESAAKAGNAQAKLALEVFAYRVKKYIGAYVAVLDGLDAVVFTGGIGENDPEMREMIVGNLSFFGLRLDKEHNQTRKTADVSIPGSRARILVVNTNEEMAIAEETRQLTVNR